MIENPGYEIPEPSTAQPGIAANWTTTTAGSLEETADFVGDSGLALSGYESFDHGWGIDDPQVLLSDLTYDTELLPPERFELGWSSRADQPFLFLTALESASFDTAQQAVEDFENGWGAPLDLSFSLSTAEVATDLFGSETAEKFEVGWGTTDFSLGVTEAAVFDAGGLSQSSATPVAAETFQFKRRQRVEPDSAADTLTATTPPLMLAVGDALTLVAESGTLPEPLASGTSYIVETVAADACTLIAFAGAAHIDITSTGSGANYVVADLGRFWLDEL